MRLRRARSVPSGCRCAPGPDSAQAAPAAAAAALRVPDARRRSRRPSGRRGRRGRRAGPRRRGGSGPRTYRWARGRPPARSGPPRALALGVWGLRGPAAVTPAATGDAGSGPASCDLRRPRQGRETGRGADGRADGGPTTRAAATSRAIGGGSTRRLYYIPRRGGAGLHPLAARPANRRRGAGPRARVGGRGAGTKERRRRGGRAGERGRGEGWQGPRGARWRRRRAASPLRAGRQAPPPVAGCPAPASPGAPQTPAAPATPSWSSLSGAISAPLRRRPTLPRP